MAIIFANGFETQNLAPTGLAASAGGSALVTTPVRTGTRAFRVSQSGGTVGYYQVTLPSTITQVYAHAAVRWDNAIPVLRFFQSNSQYIQVQPVLVGGLYYLRVSLSTIGTIGTSALPYTLATYRHVQLRWTPDADPNGRITLIEDGTTTIDFTGDTLPTTVSNIYLFYLHGITTSGIGYIDDIVIDDAQFHGDAHLELLQLSGDTATKNWTPSTGADNYALLDELPFADADYVETSVDATDDLYELADWDGTGKTPVALVAWWRAWKTTADDQRASLLINSGATLDPQTERILPLAATTYQDVVELDPDGDVAWDDASVDAVQIGIRSAIP